MGRFHGKVRDTPYICPVCSGKVDPEMERCEKIIGKSSRKYGVTIPGSVTYVHATCVQRTLGRRWKP